MTDTNLPPIESETPAPNRGRLSLASIVLIVGVMLAVSVIGIALERRHQTQPTSGLAPDFELTTFEGETIQLADLRGQIVVINFWADWCVPACHDEAPDLQRVYTNYRDQGVEFIGIAYADVDADSLSFIDRYSITYPNGPDRGSIISDDYYIQGVPETFIVDRSGAIAHTILMPTNEAQLSALLDELIASET